jgi:hypothetical protein
VAGRVGAGAAVEDCVVGAEFEVSAGSVHIGQRLPAPR